MNSSSNSGKPKDLRSKQAPPKGAGDKAEIDFYRQQIAELMTKSPQKAALILSEWVQQPAKKLSLPPEIRKKKTG